MRDETVRQYHEAAAIREDRAALIAACPSSFICHRRLAELHRDQARRAAQQPDP